MGLMATILPGVRPSISLASLPTASTSPLFLLIATIEGSFTTMPLPLAKTSVFAVPRSIARSDENKLKSERTFMADGRRAPSALPGSHHTHLSAFQRYSGRPCSHSKRNISTGEHQFFFQDAHYA